MLCNIWSSRMLHPTIYDMENLGSKIKSVKLKYQLTHGSPIKPCIILGPENEFQFWKPDESSGYIMCPK